MLYYRVQIWWESNQEVEESRSSDSHPFLRHLQVFRCSVHFETGKIETQETCQNGGYFARSLISDILLQ